MSLAVRRVGDNIPIDSAEWLSAESYWTPPRIVASGWLEHAPFAAWITSVVRPKTFVELGTHNGYSFFSFCEFTERLGTGATCYAVDTWEGDEHAGFYAEKIYEDVSVVASDLYPDTAKLLRGYFDDHVDGFADGSIDLLHIDGRHGYEDVLHDFESWLPKVANGGVVLFHDTTVLDRGFGVHRFWDEIRQKYPSFGFEHGNGLGVIGIGDYPAVLNALFTASPAEVERIQDFYARRGSVMTDEYVRRTMDENERELVAERHRAELASTEAHIAHRDAEIAEIKNSFAWKSTKPLQFVSGLIPQTLRDRLRHR
ncbi:MAG: class I SAM-dependent methyltransferase [Rhodoglobus sp.]